MNSSGGAQTDLDIRVHVLTDGKPGDIIHQYVAFTKVMDEQIKIYGRTNRAAKEAIRICEDKDILKQYLMEHEREVNNIMITLFDNDQIVHAYTREKLEEGLSKGLSKGRAEGLAEGRAEGMSKGLLKGRAEGRAEGFTEGRKKSAIETAKKMLAESLPVEMIARVSGLSVSEIKEIQDRG